MKRTLVQSKKEFFNQNPPKFAYNPAKQFKHRDRGTKAGRTSTK